MPKLPQLLVSLLVLGLSLTTPVLHAAPEKWTKEIDAYTASDAKHLPEKNGVVFVGSSSIRK